jgi:hypothetical protein
VITGPDEGPAAALGRLRAATADREHVVDQLKTAYVAGRLTRDELDTRVGQALTARTCADLTALTADLPAGPPAARPARRPARQRNRPARTPGARNAAIASASSLAAAFLLFCCAARLDDSTTKVLLLGVLLAFTLSVMLAAGAVVELRRSRRPAIAAAVASLC